LKRVLVKIGKILLYTIGGILVLLITAILLLRLPSVQQYVTDKATAFVSGKTHTKVAIEKLYIGFPKNVIIKGLFAEDLNHDTLIYLGELDVNVGLLELLNSKLAVNSLTLNGLTANIHRTLPDSSFNFDFIINAFAGKDPKPETVETDTAASTFKIEVDEIRLSGLRLLYDDEVSGMYARAVIGTLNIDMDEIDLQQMRFRIDQVLLAGTDGVFEIRKPSTQEPDTAAAGPLPSIALNKLELDGVSFGFHMIPDSAFFDVKVSSLLLEPREIDLNRQLIDLKNLALTGTDIRIAMKQQKDTVLVVTDTAPSSAGWKVAADNIRLSRNNLSYHITNMPKARSGMDYNHIEARDIELDAGDLLYSPSLIKGNIKQVSLNEHSGLDLKRLRTSFVYDSTHAELANLLVQTSRTTISNYIYAAYPSIESLAKDPGELTVNVNMKQARISMQDVLLFVPDLATQPVIAKNKHENIVINGKISGKVNDLVVKNLSIRAASQTAISLDARMKGLPDASKLWFDADLHMLTTGREDLEKLLPDSTIPASVRVPDQLLLKGKASGSLSDMIAQLGLQTSDGDVEVEGTYAEKAKVPHYTAKLRTNDLNAGKILKQEPVLGKITMTLDAKGRSFDPKQMVAEVTSEITRVEMNTYAYRSISLNAAADKGLFKADLTVDDDNLQLNLNSEASILDDSSFIKLLLDVQGADLSAMKFASRDFRSSGVIKADIRNFNREDMKGDLSIANVLLIKEGKKYKLDSLIAVTLNEKRKNNLSIRNSIVQVDYKGSTAMKEVVAVVQNHISRYLGHTKYIADTVDQDFTCEIRINPHPILSEVVLPELSKFSGIVISSTFNSTEQKLTLNANSSFIQYGDNAVSQLAANIVSDEDKLNYDISVSAVNSGSIALPKTSLSGNARDNTISFALSVIHPDSGNRLLIAGTVDQRKTSETRISIANGNIVFNNEEWAVSEKNMIIIADRGINISDLSLTHGEEYIRASSATAALNAPIDIEFGKFELGTLSRIIERDTALLRGLLDGDVHIKSLSPFAFTSALDITNISFNETPVGNLRITADNLSANRYTASVVLSGNDNSATIKGYYQNEEIDFDVDVKKLNLVSAEAFANKMIRDSKGFITAGISIKGKPSDPKLDGAVTFKDETVRIDDKGVYFKKFTVTDSAGQPLVITGSVTDFSKLNLDLDITTRHFRVMNTTIKDNKVYYGKLIVDSKISIRGDKNLPQVTADVKLDDGSSFTFVVQEGDLSTSRGEGVVFVVDTTSEDNIMSMKRDTVKMTSEFKGIDISANIEVNKNTVFRVIVDPNSGDNLEVSGDANLAFGIDQSGKVSLAGRYTLNSGHYKASFQKVLKREFSIRQGSSITWSGDPMDGQMDLTAVYTTKVGATDLLSAELAGVSENERNAYKKLLTYYVNLMIRGPILKPEISFSLDMAQRDQSAFGGLVYSRVNIINTDPNELNKQVFSLLVLNKFLPSNNSTTNTSTGTAVSTAARNSVNQVLSDQLNSLSGKYIKGAELNFNLQTTDDYVGATTQQNTALEVGVKKELFNQRVSVQVGSNIDLSGNSQQTQTTGNAQNITGDVVVEYKITQDGRYRFKAFRENQFEGIIDGMLYKTGVGVMFTRDYDTLKELFAAPKKEEEEEETGTDPDKKEPEPKESEK
jgi:hypothetical protein